MADHRVVGHGQFIAYQLDDRRHQAFALAQRQLERRAQHQAGLDHDVGIGRLSPSVARGAASLPLMVASVIRRSPASYSAQVVTCNFILEIWWRRSALCL